MLDEPAQETATSGLEIDWRSATVLVSREFRELDNNRRGNTYDVDVDGGDPRRRIEERSRKILMKLANQTVGAGG